MRLKNKLKIEFRNLNMGLVIFNTGLSFEIEVNLITFGAQSFRSKVLHGDEVSCPGLASSQNQIFDKLQISGHWKLINSTQKRLNLKLKTIHTIIIKGEAIIKGVTQFQNYQFKH